MTKKKRMILDPQLRGDGWLTPDTYGNEYEPLPNASGVYLLESIDRSLSEWGSRGICYVGQATDVKRRLSNHEILKQLRRDPGKDGYGIYVRRWFKYVEVCELRTVERHYIEFFDPPFNIIGRRRGWKQ